MTLDVRKRVGARKAVNATGTLQLPAELALARGMDAAAGLATRPVVAACPAGLAVLHRAACPDARANATATGARRARLPRPTEDRCGQGLGPARGGGSRRHRRRRGTDLPPREPARYRRLETR